MASLAIKDCVHKWAKPLHRWGVSTSNPFPKAPLCYILCRGWEVPKTGTFAGFVRLNTIVKTFFPVFLKLWYECPEIATNMGCTVWSHVSKKRTEFKFITVMHSACASKADPHQPQWVQSCQHHSSLPTGKIRGVCIGKWAVPSADDPTNAIFWAPAAPHTLKN